MLSPPQNAPFHLHNTRSQRKRLRSLTPTPSPALLSPPIPSPLLSLPSEIFFFIAHCLDSNSLLRTLRTHRDLRDLINDRLTWQFASMRPNDKDGFLSSLLSSSPLVHLTSLDLDALPTLTDFELHSILLYASSLTSLNLSSLSHLSNRAFVSLSRLLSSNLRRIHFPSDSDAHLDAVSLSLTVLSHSRLQEIHLTSAPYLGPDCLLHLSLASSLRSLTLHEMKQLTDRSFAFLAVNSRTRPARTWMWPSLNSVDLTGCSQLTDGTVALLARLPSLTSLNLSHNQRVTAQGLQALSEGDSMCREGLQSLTLNGCAGLTDECGAAVLDLPALTSLSLDGCLSLTAALLLGLAVHPSLQHLAMSQPLPSQLPYVAESENPSPALHLFLSKSPSLTSIALSGFPPSAEEMSAVWSDCTLRLSSLVLTALQGCHSLSFLHLHHSAFAHLTVLELNCLDLSGCDDSGSSLSFPLLRRLSLRECGRNGEKALRRFRSSPLLVHLSMAHNPSLTTDSCAFISQHFPLVSILDVTCCVIPKSGLISLSTLPHLHTLILDSVLSLSNLSVFTSAVAEGVPFPALRFVSFGAARDVDVSRWRGALRQARGGSDGLRVVEMGEEMRRREEEEDEEEDWEPPDVAAALRDEKSDEEGDAEAESEEEDEEEREDDGEHQSRLGNDGAAVGFEVEVEV